MRWDDEADRPMSSSNDRLEELFATAAALSDDRRRVEFLDRECPDAGLRREVESLLAAHERPDTLFAKNSVRTGLPEAECVGTVIGRYKLLEALGEGGFGAVWLAEQKEPLRRKVALKIIKLGMDTEQVVARFEAERQALALMDHPNIAKVLDAGATDSGRPYFVMELVRGIPITRFCDENESTPHERLELFTKVCQAVQHAHQKGIIHRDLKPSNVLVTLHDGLPVPKVIDFGIAKATQQDLTGKTIHTQFHQFVGTPAYVSPEQAEMSGLDIDTRCDIYSLGVLLYELLTGETPFDGRELLASGLDEMRRTIREKEPLRPSQVVANRNELRVGRVASGFPTGSTQLKLLSTDLDWIVMKCLEKDRTRRYDTANGLALDVQRHLNNEPVEARPPGNFYRAQKLVRRNRAIFAALGAILLVMLGGGAVAISLLLRENAAVRRALIAEQAAKAEQSRNAQAARSMAQSGTAFLERGDIEAAEQFLLEALAMQRAAGQETDKQTAEVLSALAHLRHGQRDYEEAERLARESIAIRRRLQLDDLALARTLNFLGDARYERGDLADAERCFREGLAVMRRNGTNDSATLVWSLYALADTLERRSRFAEAEPLYRELTVRPEATKPLDDRVLSPAAGLARCLTGWAWEEHQQGKTTQALSRAHEAESLLRECLKARLEEANDDHWQQAELRSRMGDALVVAAVVDGSLPRADRLRKFAKAEALALESEQRLRSDTTVEPAFQRDALERLVRLYESWNAAAPDAGAAAKAENWRQKLSTLQNERH